MGLSLLTVAMEAGGNHLSQYRSLLALCQNEIMRALFRLIQGESLGKFRVSRDIRFYRFFYKFLIFTLLIETSDFQIFNKQFMNCLKLNRRKE